ncbi:MAG: SPOR domain-containing protein [Candidatus Omnitrophota bacterium]
MAEEYQKELFEEFGEQKSKLKRIAERITQRQRKFYLRVSLENVVFAAIIAVMCVIVAFAMGVERGKRVAPPLAPQKKVTPPAKEPEIKAVKQRTTRTYAIQLISYRKKRLAEKEKRKLLDKNIEAFIVPSGEWFQVCAGGYGDIKDAKAGLKQFSKDYKGCFIRKKEKEE